MPPTSAPLTRNASTRPASAIDAVSPGDSMPNKLTSPATPCSASVCTAKSAAASPGAWILGRAPA
eukprot:scaffold17561_cov71-Phaeocystis_antarctica.AAC.2